MKLFRQFLVILSLLCSTVVPINPACAAQIDPAIASEIQKAVAQLDQYHQAQIRAGIQEPNLCYAMRKALILADLLVDASGKLRADICQQVKPYFISSQPLEYEQNISRVLDILDSSWQSFFDAVKKPQNQSYANLILRALFSLSAKDMITDRHAKVAILSAMFAPENQGPVGDCFAVADLIRDHQKYFKHSAQDYAEIVQKGYLTRLVNTQDDNFFFLPTIADIDCDKTFHIDTAGNIKSANIALFNAPGFSSASNVMGGDQVPNLLQNVTQLLFQGAKANTVQVTASRVIEACAEVIAMHQPGLAKEELMAKGCYGFSSLTNNPVLRATECAFAAMAEDRPQDSTRGNINYCVAKAMEGTWNSIGSTSKDFETTFAALFDASYRLVYNLDIPLSQPSADGSSTDGGFQLYQRISNQPEVIGVRIATPEDFRELVLNAITLAQNKLNSSESASKIAQQLSDFVQNGTFLRDALWAYDHANTKENDPVKNYQNLPRTPMQSCDGDNPYEVDDIDTKQTFENSIQTYTPANSQALIQWCLDLSKKAPDGLLPMNSPQHAFNFVPGNADIKAFQTSGVSSKDWVKQVLIIPGMKIATRKIDSNTEAILSNAVFNIISKALPDPTGYQNLVKQMSGKSLTVQKFAQGIVDGVNSLLNSNAFQASEVALLVDYLLLQVLPVNDLNIIQSSAIRFAFTNWNDGSKNIYFCTYFNLRTAQVGFGSIDEDKSSLQPMDEAAWINNQQWDVDLNPLAPSLTSTGS